MHRVAVYVEIFYEPRGRAERRRCRPTEAGVCTRVAIRRKCLRRDGFPRHVPCGVESKLAPVRAYYRLNYIYSRDFGLARPRPSFLSSCGNRCNTLCSGGKIRVLRPHAMTGSTSDRFAASLLSGAASIYPEGEELVDVQDDYVGDPGGGDGETTILPFRGVIISSFKLAVRHQCQWAGLVPLFVLLGKLYCGLDRLTHDHARPVSHKPIIFPLKMRSRATSVFEHGNLCPSSSTR